MSNYPSNQRPDKAGRNERIWYETAINGKTKRQVALEFGISEQRVAQIIRQVIATIPKEEKDATRRFRHEFQMKLREMIMEIAYLPPPPAFAPNGKPHIDPATGQTIRDYGTRLAAITAAFKADERWAKLTGTDNGADVSVTVSNEAAAATQEQADKRAAQFRMLIPESAEVATHASRS